MTLLRGDPSKREWSETVTSFIMLASKGWFYASPQTQTTLLDELIAIFIESERDDVLIEQLTSLLKPNDLTLDNPESVHTFVLKVELLAGMRCSQRLPPRLRATLTEIQETTVTTCAMEEARTEALNLIAKKLVPLTELESRTTNLWQSWTGLVDSITNKAKQFNTYAYPIQLILESTIDLTRESRTRDLLGSLTSLVEWDDSICVKEFLEFIYADNQFPINKLWTIGRY